MFQRISNPLRRAVHARLSGPAISTGDLGLLVAHGVSRSCSLNTVSKTPRKTHGSLQLLCPMSSSAVQHGAVRRRTKRIVNNLDPKHPESSDIIDLKGLMQPWVTFGPTGTKVDYISSTPSPQRSTGFLYYHSRPGLPAATGEIRFRVVDSGSASHSAADLFANGRDLLDHTGHRPWRIHMLQLYTRRTYGPIRQLLRSQGLIGATQECEIEQRVSAVQLNNVGLSTILDSISDTFVIQLPTTTLSLAFIHDECIVPAIRMAHILSWGDRPEAVEGSDAARWRAYQGAGLVRFELRKAGTNRVFRSAKEGEVVLVLRILELLDPPLGPDGVPFRLPEGGDLAQGKSPGRYWCMSLDRAQKLGIVTPSSLKILEELYLGDIATSAETTTTKSPSS